jgi:hypothetical protein
MSEFSIEALDAAARGISGKSQPVEPNQKKKLFGQNVSDMQPTLQAEQDAPMPAQPQNSFSFDMKNLDKQAYQIASGQIKAPKSGTSSLATFGQGLASLADTTIGGVIPAVAGAATYAGARAAQQTPEQAQALQQKVAGWVDKPFGKMARVTETAGYKNEASQKLMEYIGQHVGEGAEAISKKLGIPAADIENMIGTLTMAGAPSAAKVGGAIKKGVFAADQALVNEAQMLGGAAKDATKPMQDAFEKVKNKLPTVRMEKAPAETMKGMGAAEVDAARLRQERGNELLIPMGDDLTKSQITRNPADVMFERETAKSPEFGAPLQEKYALHNEKLQRNLQAEVEQTGAQMVGMDAPDFGKVVSDTVGKYKNERYQDVSNTYKAAQEAGETAQPVSYKGINDLILKETQGRPTKKAQNPLYAIVEEELKANDPQGNGLIPINAMEDIRKLINEEADPAKKGSVRLGKQLKNEIDKATENAGGDLYKEARAKNRAFEAEFQDQGIIRDITRLKKGTSDRVVPLENLADKLVFKGTGADVKTVFATLEKMGPDGQQIANELRGYAADKIKEQATKGVGRDINGKPYVSTAELDKQINALDKSGKLDFLFGKQQAERYRTLNEFTKDLQTTPQGTVNNSGTTSTMLAALGEMALTGFATGVPAPVTTIATYGAKKYRANQKMKKVQEYANPKGTLADMHPTRIELNGMANKE